MSHQIAPNSIVVILTNLALLQLGHSYYLGRMKMGWAIVEPLGQRSMWRNAFFEFQEMSHTMNFQTAASRTGRIPSNFDSSLGFQLGVRVSVGKCTQNREVLFLTRKSLWYRAIGIPDHGLRSRIIKVPKFDCSPRIYPKNTSP